MMWNLVQPFWKVDKGKKERDNALQPVGLTCMFLELGERLSPWVAVGCFTMGVSIIFF